MMAFGLFIIIVLPIVLFLKDILLPDGLEGDSERIVNERENRLNKG